MLYFVTILFFSEIFALPSTTIIPLQKNISFFSFFTTLWYFLQQAFVSFWHFFKQLNFSTWQPWVYGYIMLAIASHMQLSLPDMRTMFRGLFVLCVILLLGMIIAEVWKFSVVSLLSASKTMNYLYVLLLFAICVSTVNFVITFVFTTIVRFIRSR